MIISLIAAQGKNRIIGLKNQLPWDIPEDLNYFKEKTKGRIIIMGRKTFESLPKLLPKRLHIVISRSPQSILNSEFVKSSTSIEEALKTSESFIPPWPEEVFIIGGGEIYLQSLPYAHQIYLTEIEKDFLGDASFPKLNSEEWKLSSSVAGNSINPKTTEQINFHFNIYKNKKPKSFNII